MPAQVLGILVTIVGVFWFIGSIASAHGIANLQQLVTPLWGIITLVGGLLLWALGRIECAVAPSPDKVSTTKVLSWVMFVVFAGAVAIYCWQIHLGRV